MLVGHLNCYCPPVEGGFPLPALQTDRLEAFADKVLDNGLRLDALFVCELEDPANAQKLAASLGMGVLATTSNYDDSGEGAAMLASAAVQDALVDDADVGLTNEDVGPIIIARTRDLSLIGAHYPHRVWKDRKSRARASAAIIGAAETQAAILMLDPNCLEFQWPRQMLHYAGFATSSWQVGKAGNYPAPGWREYCMTARHLPFRRLKIDDIRTRGLKVNDAGAFYTEADHPFRWLDVATP